MIGSFGHLMPQKSARVSLVKLTGSDPKIFSRVRFLLENSIQKRRSPLPRLPTFHHGKWFCVLTEYGYSVSAESGGFGAAVLSACYCVYHLAETLACLSPVGQLVLESCLQSLNSNDFYESENTFTLRFQKKRVGPKNFQGKITP